MRLFYSLALLCLSLFSVRAQVNELEINYIAHDHYNDALLEVVDDIFNSKAYDSSRHTYLYLANANDSRILLCDVNKVSEFEEFKYTLNEQIAHTVWPETDVKNIVDLVNADDFLYDTGERRYQYLTLNFYVTPSFFTYGYPEAVISRIFWDLELATKKDVLVNIYVPEDVKTEQDTAKLFGSKNLLGDYKVFIYTFKVN